MKSFKKILALLLALVMVMSLAACGGSTDDNDDSDKDKVDIDDSSLYLITDLGTIEDKSFNQGSFEGMEKFADEIGVKANYIRPAGEGDQIYLQAVEQAIEAGAKVVVTPGFLFESAIGEAQKAHPEVKFIAVDFEPKDGDDYVVADNTVAILYKEEQPGFMAGYALVKDGYTKLGYMGGVAVPAVIRYGFGFAYGAEVAAEELGVDVDVKFNYTGSFVEKPEIKTMAASWYEEGTEVIFAAGGGIFNSINQAALEAEKLVVGVDVDQKEESDQVITSAMKNLRGTVYDATKKAIEGGFEGGKTLTLGVESDAVQISDDFSRFNTFNEEDYKELYAKLKNNEDNVLDEIPQIDSSLDQTKQGDPTIWGAEKLERVTLEYIQ